jgi:5-methylcytosine-specific restriction protein A
VPPKPRNTGPSRKVREEVIKREGGRCRRCRRQLSLGEGQVHHRQPRQMGGTRRPWINHPLNLAYLCLPCHLHIESHRQESYDMGWLVPMGMDPREVPWGP